jgi:biopolymer transport protein TolR
VSWASKLSPDFSVVLQNMAFAQFEQPKPPKPMSDINITPLVDVMLVLVVILIMTAPLLASSLKLALPKTSAATPVEPSKPAQTPPLLLSLDAKGVLYLNKQTLNDAALAVQLTQAAQEDPETELRLRADAAVPYGRVVAVLGLAQKAGLSRIGFMAEPDQTAAPSKIH